MKNYIIKSLLSMGIVLSIFSTNAYAIEPKSNTSSIINVDLSTNNNLNDTAVIRHDLNDPSFTKKNLTKPAGINPLSNNNNKVNIRSFASINAIDNKENDKTTDTDNTNTDSTDTDNTDLKNTDPNNAAYFDVNAVYRGAIKADQEQRWYLTHLDKKCKLTVYLQTVTTADVNYDLHLFSYNEKEGEINEVDSSNYGSGVDEQISAILDSGYYFVCVNSVTGFDANNEFNFATITSDKYDSAEPDDNFFTSSKKEGTDLSINQTIDNPLDNDWMEINVKEKSYVESSLTNVDNKNKYVYVLYNSNSEALTSEAFENGYTYSFVLEPGTYYIRVVSTNGFDADKPYNLKINMQNYDEYINSRHYNCSAVNIAGDVRACISSDCALTQNCYAYVDFYGRASGAYRDFVSSSSKTGSVSAYKSFDAIVKSPLSYIYKFQYAFVRFYVDGKLVGTQYVY